MALRNSISIILLLLFFGCDKPIPEEVREIKEFNIWADEHEVTAKDFEDFQNQFDVRIASDTVSGWWFSAELREWKPSRTASHLKPDGESRADSLAPAVQVSWADACAYCNARNGRLPSINEWMAMTSGVYTPGNIWEGYFPFRDEGLDGFRATSSPVKSFKAHENGLYDLFGNVWEWTNSSDAKGKYYIKGGSFLSDYNSGGFLPDYSKAFSADSLRADLGFRCVYNITH